MTEPKKPNEEPARVEVLRIRRPALPPFHPFANTDPAAPYPETELTARVLHIRHTWDEMTFLNGLCMERDSEHERLILYKSVLTLLHSLFAELAALHNVLMQLPPRGQGAPGEESLSDSERDTIRSLFKTHNQLKDRAQQDVASIRNKIGAHHGYIPFDEQVVLWSKLDPDRFLPVINSIPPIWRFVRALPIYTWAREFEDGAFLIEMAMPPDEPPPVDNRA